MQAVFADIFPAGILRQVGIGVKETFLDEAVDTECIKCHDLPFYKAKTVKSVFQKKLRCKVFNIVKDNDIISENTP